MAAPRDPHAGAGEEGVKAAPRQLEARAGKSVQNPQPPLNLQNLRPKGWAKRPEREVGRRARSAPLAGAAALPSGAP